MTNSVGFRSTTLVFTGLVALLMTILAACGPGGDMPPPTNGDTSVNVTVDGPGRVIQDDFSCTGSCTWTTDGSQPVTLQAVPDSGNVLVAWGGVCPVLDENCTRTFEDGDEVVVTFAPHAVRLDLTGDGEGSFQVLGAGANETCTDDCGVPVFTTLDEVDLGIEYRALGTSGTQLGPWTGACEGAASNERCDVTVSGATEVGMTWVHPPDAVPDTYQTGVGTPLTVESDSDGDGDKGVLDNDVDTEGDPLSVSRVVSDVSHGRLTLDPDGGFEYVPNAGYEGRDTFRYRVRDAYGNTDEADVEINIAVLALSKVGTFNDEDGDELADVDETIDYTFTVTNTGAVTLTNVTVTDDLIGDTLAGGPITLAPGEVDSTTFTGSYAVTQGDIDAGQVVNTAQATSDETTDPTPATHTTTLPQDASLALTKAGTFDDEDGDGFADVGEPIDYTFTVTNTGNVTLTNVAVTDPLVGLSAITLASGDTDGDDQLDPTETWTYTATYPIDQDDIDAGQVVNTAETTSDDTTTPVNSDEETVDLPQEISLALTKVGTFDDVNSDGVANVGEPIHYTFTVENAGNVTLTNVTVADPLDGLSAITLASGDADGDDQLDPTETWMYTATYPIDQDDIDAGEVENTATADSDESPSDSGTETVSLPTE